MLKTDEQALIAIADNADRFYRSFKKEKPDGTFRTIFDAKPPLKSIQARIQCLILKKIIYPRYLHGGIKDRDHPRDSASNAALHQNGKVLLCEDIANFFPSVSFRLVYQVWVGLLHFSPEVARCLTKLTTNNGCLPQGAKTSTLLANLVLWREEPHLHRVLKNKGIEYSRYIDDIACSSRRALTGAELAQVISRISGMCTRNGLRLKRSKQEILRSSERMQVTKLVTNQRISVPWDRRSRIRSEVRQCEETASAPEMRKTQPYRVKYNSVVGKVGHLARFHPAQAAKLKQRLKDIPPCDTVF